MARVCNRDDQQHIAKYNDELWTKRTKATWKAINKTMRRGWNGSVKAWLSTDYDQVLFYVYELCGL